MLTAVLGQGIFFLVTLGLLSRWSDIRILRQLCFTTLLCDLLIFFGWSSHLGVTHTSVVLGLGSFGWGWGLGSAPVTVLDFISASFASLLLSALLLCFLLLSEYFEYDLNAVSIVNLSALFSQLALLFFTSGDLIWLLICWEWISLVSLFLVQFWAWRVASIKAGLKVFVISQCGDIFFILGCLLYAQRVNSSNLTHMLAQVPIICADYIQVGPLWIRALPVVSLLLASATLLKAAQLVFYPWLLDAMEAPVPISAQLHSSTLVIIGFYLYFRLLPLHSASLPTLGLFIFCGLVTAVGASILGALQEDAKRLLACSTAGQLGYVVTGLGVGLPEESWLLLFFCCSNKAWAFVWLGVAMSQASGISDFRANSSWGWWEPRAGLGLAALNTTIGPGALSWHVKGLLGKGGLSDTHSLALGVLSLTWFFSGLYLTRLLIGLFAQPKHSSTNLSLWFFVGLCCYGCIILPLGYACVTSA